MEIEFCICISVRPLCIMCIAYVSLISWWMVLLDSCIELEVRVLRRLFRIIGVSGEVLFGKRNKKNLKLKGVWLLIDAYSRFHRELVDCLLGIEPWCSSVKFCFRHSR